MSEERLAEAVPDEEYEGEAVLFTAEREVPVAVLLRGHFQPIDGRFHWYGRVAADDAVAELAGGRKTQVVLRTTRGEAVGSLSDPDPWNRYRITGVGRPPF
ncbi:DUF4873 domain-containing protein [Saccharopolyspora sp. NPDC047091]|uniref:DUF4873 domain-containing protein n=1 Tax=Saccharopolyspora sp. NPDC047091 TaxID=3155924 RepID=UPI0033F0EBB4